MLEIDWKKLYIGSSLSILTAVTGGNAAEQIKTLRQTQNTSYYKIIRSSINQRGYYSFLYRGYFPWGLIQSSIKGLPILFIPNEVNKRLKYHNINYSYHYITGSLGGAIQGLITTPTQRLKILSYTNDNNKADVKHIIDVLKGKGLNTLFRGCSITMVRRSIDWGLRYYGMNTTIDYYNKNLHHKKQNKLISQLLGGLNGGILTTLTTPIDTIISKHQSTNTNVINNFTLNKTIKNLYNDGGIKRFYRGFWIRLLFASYSTVVMIGIGNYL